MNFFAGVSSTQFGNAVAGTTARRQFSRPEGTAAQRPSETAQTPPESPGLANWLRSDEARRLAGRWVLLSEDFRVLDSDLSPSGLLQRHPNEVAPRVVLVDPPGVQLAV